MPSRGGGGTPSTCGDAQQSGGCTPVSNPGRTRAILNSTEGHRTAPPSPLTSSKAALSATRGSVTWRVRREPGVVGSALAKQSAASSSRCLLVGMHRCMP